MQGETALAETRASDWLSAPAAHGLASCLNSVLLLVYALANVITKALGPKVPHLGPQLGIKAKSNKKSTLAVGCLSMVVIVCGNAPMKTQSLRSYATPIISSLS